VLFYEIFKVGVVQLEADGDVDEKAGGDCASVRVDPDDFLDLRPGVDRHEDGPGILLVLEGYAFHEQILGVEFETSLEMRFWHSVDFLLHL